MEELIKETAILAPQVVIKKAKDLYEKKLYSSALEILEANSIRFDIYEKENRMEINIPKAKRRVYPFDKNKKVL